MSGRYARRPDDVNVWLRKRILRKPLHKSCDAGGGGAGLVHATALRRHVARQVLFDSSADVPAGRRRVRALAPTPSVSRLVQKLLGALLDLLTAE